MSSQSCVISCVEVMWPALHFVTICLPKSKVKVMCLIEVMKWELRSVERLTSSAEVGQRHGEKGIEHLLQHWTLHPEMLRVSHHSLRGTVHRGYQGSAIVDWEVWKCGASWLQKWWCKCFHGQKGIGKLLKSKHFPVLGALQGDSEKGTQEEGSVSAVLESGGVAQVVRVPA
jgi:hypothetical protein